MGAAIAKAKALTRPSTVRFTTELLTKRHPTPSRNFGGQSLQNKTGRTRGLAFLPPVAVRTHLVIIYLCRRVGEKDSRARLIQVDFGRANSVPLRAFR
jgi:hypothetical protein